MLPFSLPEDFSSTETVLFLGSGFSKGAVAINGKELPLGGQLDDRLAELLKLPPQRYQGKTLAQLAGKRDPELLKDFLDQNLTIKECQNYHRVIINTSWYRVYTTNFDNLVEFVRNESGEKLEVKTFRDPLPNKFEKNAVVHLHGYLGRVNRSNVRNELIYALNAYASLHSEQPEWFADLNRAVKFAKNVIFVGYSVEYDEHIRDILAQIPDLREKTTFVLGGDPDPVIEEILGDYGSVSWVGSSGLADALASVDDMPPPSIDKRRMRSFEYFNPNKDNKSHSEITFSEIRNLLIFGNYNRNRFYRDIDDGKYLIYRDGDIKKARDLIERGMSVLLHSHLGNGKSLFIETLSAELTKRSYECFIFKAETSSLINEAQFISTIKKAIVIFDDYTIAREVVPVIRKEAPGALFVLTIRTGTFDYRFQEVGRSFGDKLGTIDLNWLEKDVFQKFEKWASAAGIVATKHRDGYGRLRHIREFILDKFDHSPMLKEKVRHLTEVLERDRPAFRAFIVLMVFRHMGEEAQTDIITYKILGFDPHTKLGRYSDLWGEVSNGAREFESSVFSQFVISHFVESDELLRIVEEIVGAVSVSREGNKRDDAIFAKSLNFGQLYLLTGSDEAGTDAIIRSYNRLRHNEKVASQPLFWLQVAIAMTAKDDMREAWSYIKVAYSKATAQFEPYHIDTKATEVLFRLGANPDEEFGSEEFSGLDSSLESCSNMISNDRNRTDVLKSLSYAHGFIAVRSNSLENGQKVRLAFHLSKIVERLEGMPAEIKARQGTEELKRELSLSIKLMT